MKLRHLVLPALSILFFPACESDPAGADGGLDAAPADGGVPDGGAAEVPPVMTGDCATLTPTTTLAAGFIEADQTWRGVVAVNGDVRVAMAKITIEAGTTFLMAADSAIEFGWNSSTVSVFARGTAAAPIRFCGRTPTAGLWNKISIGTKVTSDSVLENVVISGGGQKTGAALEMASPILINNVVVAASGADGVHATAFKAGSANLSVMGAAKAPVMIRGEAAATAFPVGGGFSGNGNNVVLVDLDDISEEITFKNPGIPYLQLKSIRVLEPVKVTFEAGVDYRMAVDTVLEIGWNSNPATIVANGTMAAPVLFGRASPTAGMWKSIIIQRMVKSDSVLNYVTISGGGNGEPALDIRGAITLKNVTLDGNQEGLSLVGPGLGATSTALTITRTMGPPATTELVTAVTLPKTGSAFTGNTNDWIVIDGNLTESFRGVGTLQNLGVPYRVEGELQTRDASQLTFEAGTTFLMGPDSGFEFGWNSSPSKVTAVGTAAAPIVFKGVEDTVGYWNGMLFGTMVASTSKFAYVQIANGGKAIGAGIELLKMGVDITNSKFSKSAGYGIKKVLGDPTDYTAGGNTFEGNTLGPVGPVP